jgi:Na+/proline symporter
MMSAKDERHSLFATLWFTIAHYCLRPWPWILVALASLVLYPNLTDTRAGYVLVMRDVLPSGMLGLLAAGFLAAFMSTISTQLNWGVSYLVNDFWRRFIKTDGDERYYVIVSRVLTFVVAIVSIFVTTRLDSISGAWGLILTASAGLGLVLILRWYWWRINAWSELTATLVPIIMVALALIGVPIYGLDAPFPNNLFIVVTITTLIWVTVTFFTAPTDRATLDAFFRRVRPGGPGWGPVALRHQDVRPDQQLGPLVIDWIAGVTLVYATLFGTGYLLFGRTGAGLLALGLALLCGGFLWWDLGRRETGSVGE